MTDIEQLLAKAIWDAPGPDGDHIAVYFTDNFRCDGTTKEESHKWAFMVAQMAARACLTALSEAGWVVIRKDEIERLQKQSLASISSADQVSGRYW